MSSNFSKFLDRREISKKVDQLVSDLAGGSIVTPVVDLPPDFEKKIVQTSPETLVQDVYQVAVNTRKDIENVIASIKKENGGDAVFDSFFNASQAQFSTPKDGNLKTNPIPPSNIQTIVERDVFRRQRDPRVILVKDLYRARSQAASIEYSYSESLNKIISNNNSYFSNISNASLLTVILMKDKHLLTNLKDHLNKVNELVDLTLENKFFAGLGGLVRKNTGALSDFSTQVDYLLTIEQDHQFDEYKQYEDTVETVIGTVANNIYDKLTRNNYIGILFGFSPNLLKVTENLEKLGDILNPSSHLFKFRQVIDRSLLRALSQIENELLSSDQKFYQSTEARTNLISVVSDSSLVKFFGASTNTIDKLSKDKNLESNDTISDAIRRGVESFKVSTLKIPDQKALKAAEQLAKWSKIF